LTTGQLRVADVVAVSSMPAAHLLAMAAAVESRAQHPVAAAVLARARAEGVSLPSVTGFTSLAGLGAEGEVQGVRVLVGNERLFEMRGIAVPWESPGLADAQAGGGLVALVAVDEACVGGIVLEDRTRPTARETIGLLRELGVRRVAMLSGDHERTAARVASDLGLDEFHARLLPEQKYALIGALRSRYGAVLMVGDGINDAPALAAADVGMAMGAAGSDTALETADVALMSDELLRLPYAIRLAKATMRNVKVNMAISLALKAIFLVMAVAGLATLWMAVLADTGASVIVVGNALRLLRTR
jgi:Cd2+/Zn2+-exporting ATPase